MLIITGRGQGMYFTYSDTALVTEFQICRSDIFIFDDPCFQITLIFCRKCGNTLHQPGHKRTLRFWGVFFLGGGCFCLFVVGFFLVFFFN